MKVIQRGTPYKAFRHTCTTCGALLDVEEADIQCSYYAGDQRNDSETTYHATCPCCEYPFVVKRANLTDYLATRLLKKARGY